LTSKMRPKWGLIDMPKKLHLLDAALSVEDMRLPPSNHLERLFGDLEGRWSIRINDQWRICFRWIDDHATNVMIVDYH
jgi:toxin HigB-1